MRARLTNRRQSNIRPAAWAELWGGFISFYTSLTRNGNVLLPGTWRDKQDAWRSDVTFWESNIKINRQFAKDIAQRLQKPYPNKTLKDEPILAMGEFPQAVIAQDKRWPNTMWLELTHGSQMVQIRIRIFESDVDDQSVTANTNWPRGAYHTDRLGSNKRSSEYGYRRYRKHHSGYTRRNTRSVGEEDASREAADYTTQPEVACMPVMRVSNI